MTHLSPSTVVKAPSPWMTKRMAAGEWRWAEATSRGSRYWKPAHGVWVAP